MTMIEQEIWADIPGFPRYAVSSQGRIYNKIFESMMKPSISTAQGNLKISLIDEDEIRRAMGVAHLVANAFVERPNYLCTEVILRDGNLSNVAASNLAWRGPRTAYLYARQMRSKPKAVYNVPVRNLVTGAEYETIIQAGIVEGLIWQEIWESTYTVPKQPVPPFFYTYEVIRV